MPVFLEPFTLDQNSEDTWIVTKNQADESGGFAFGILPVMLLGLHGPTVTGCRPLDFFAHADLKRESRCVEKPASLVDRTERPDRPVIRPRTLRAGTGTRSTPGLRRQRRGNAIDPHLTQVDPQPLVAFDGQDIGLPVRFECPAEVRVVAVDGVASHPRRLHSGFPRPLEHSLGEPWLGGECDLRRDPGGLPANRIISPLLGKIQFPVDLRMATPSGEGQKDADLAVLDAPGSASVLPLHTGRLHPLLQEAGLVDDQNALRITPMFS